MNRNFLVVILLDIFLLTGPILRAVAADKTVVNVFILAGQSNMAGADSEVAKPPGFQQTTADRVTQFTMAPLPLGERSNQYVSWEAIRGHQAKAKLVHGPEVGFARSLHAAGWRDVAIIKVHANFGRDVQSWPWGRGGTLFNSWTEFVDARLAELTAQGHSTRVCGFVWHQGIDDAIHRKLARHYERNLKDLIGALRKRYATQQTPFVLARSVNSRIAQPEPDPENRSPMAVVRRAQMQIGKSVSGVAWIDVDDLPNVNTHHFSANSQIVIGRRFGETFLGLQRKRANGWRAHEVRQLTGKASVARLAAKLQIVTERWNRVAAVPYIVYMPEKDRLLMLVSCDYPHHAEVLFSDDRGLTWSDPKPAILGSDGLPLPALGTGLCYLGDGNVLFYAGSRWFSRDYGQTWKESARLAPTPDGKPWAIWDPPLVETTGRLVRLIETGYQQSGPQDSQAFLRSSTDGGATWSSAARIVQWKGVNEVALLRATNGHLVAACRTIIPVRLQSETIDHLEGLGISISTDDGRTWSDVRKLYDWGRHHPSLVLLPGGDIVMTHVVRKGYIDSADGFPQFGIEAAVSHDHGQTWDLDHRYLLHTWVGNRKGSSQNLPGPQAWWASSKATSTVLLPDGNLVTAFGTGYRSQPNAQGMPSPRDVGLVQWRLNTRSVGSESRIRDADAESDLRNRLDPRTGEPSVPEKTTP